MPTIALAFISTLWTGLLLYGIVWAATTHLPF